MTNIADKILTHLKDYCDKRIIKFYYGDPLVIPASNLPAIVVENKSSSIAQTATGLDELSSSYSIKLIMNKKDEIGKNPEEVVLQRTMADIVMGVDTNNNYKDNSIVGILRKYFTLGNALTDQNISIDFSLSDRAGLITEEAQIIINIQDFVSVTVRS